MRIPAGLSSYPTLSSDVEVGTIEVADGGALTIPSSRTLTVTGNFTNEGSSALSLGDGTLKLNGSSAQSINGPLNCNLEIDNSNDVTLGAETTIGTLTLTSGDLDIGNNNLVLGSATGGSSTGYVKISGTGRVSMEVGSSPVTFPIGRNPYEPIVIDDGGNATYSVGVYDNVYDDPTTQSIQKTSLVVGETWTIQASTASTGVSVTLQWDASQEETSFDRSSCMIGYWENGVATAWNANGSNGTASGSDPYTLSRTIDFTTNLYYLGVGSSGSALPVELTYFTAHWQEQGKTAQLNWQTAQEINNSHFEIERSFDGENWEAIGRVEGAGNSIAPVVYSYIDKSPSLAEGTLGMGQTIYYRLKQVDYNAAYEYSPTRTLNFKLETRNFKLYPNPTTGQVIISTDMQLQEVKIYNLQGKLMQTGNGNQLDVSALPVGQYILEANDGSRVYREKILKQ